MFPYWHNVTLPLLKALQPKAVVEVGSEQGKSTDLILDFCTKNDVVLHVIEPAPHYDPAEYSRRFGKHFIFYKDLSIRALPNIQGRYDAVLLDGDHNWFTVYTELSLIERHCLQNEQPFPLVLLHDVGWPYGRRDLYYNPATIPDEYRQPYARKGMWPGRSTLLDEGGFNAGYCHALEENTPRNGVRTAIEDFLRETTFELDFLFVPGFFGLGILVRKELRQTDSPFATVLNTWDFARHVSSYLQQLENVRVQLMLQRLQWKQSQGG